MLKFSGFANLTSCLERKRWVSRMLLRTGASSMAPSRKVTITRESLPSYSPQKHSHTNEDALFATKAEKTHFDAQ